jgi:hypothetical protein
LEPNIGFNIRGSFYRPGLMPRGGCLAAVGLIHHPLNQLNKPGQLKFRNPLNLLSRYPGGDGHLGKNQPLGHFQGAYPVIVKTFNDRPEDPFLLKKNDPRLSGDQSSPVLAKKTPDPSEDMLGCSQIFREQLILRSQNTSKIMQPTPALISSWRTSSLSRTSPYLAAFEVKRWNVALMSGDG